eukprot:g34951.t1
MRKEHAEGEASKSQAGEASKSQAGPNTSNQPDEAAGPINSDDEAEEDGEADPASTVSPMMAALGIQLPPQ